MRTSNAELLAEIDTLEDIKRVDAKELEVVKYIEKLESRVAIFKVSNKVSEFNFSTKENADKFMAKQAPTSGLSLTIIGFVDL